MKKKYMFKIEVFEVRSISEGYRVKTKEFKTRATDTDDALKTFMCTDSRKVDVIFKGDFVAKYQLYNMKNGEAVNCEEILISRRASKQRWFTEKDYKWLNDNNATCCYDDKKTSACYTIIKKDDFEMTINACYDKRMKQTIFKCGIFFYCGTNGGFESYESMEDAINKTVVGYMDMIERVQKGLRAMLKIAPMSYFKEA